MGNAKTTKNDILNEFHVDGSIAESMKDNLEKFKAIHQKIDYLIRYAYRSQPSDATGNAAVLGGIDTQRKSWVTNAHSAFKAKNVLLFDQWVRSYDKLRERIVENELESNWKPSYFLMVLEKKYKDFPQANVSEWLLGDSQFSPASLYLINQFIKNPSLQQPLEDLFDKNVYST